ncbi:MAG TPA: M48 family metalloprotease [Actinomycetota bacterium]|nr:M48 family metalloprotease [Actinomycetota bacterium]
MPRPPAADPLEAFTEDEVRACVDYAKPRQRWGLAGYGTDLLVLAALALTGPGRALVRGVAGLAGGWAPGRVVLAAVAVLLLRAAVGLPFSIRAFRQDTRAGLATQGLAGFLRDWAKGRAVGLVLTVVALTALVLGARWEPPGWPLVAAVAAVLLVLALAMAGPVLIEPLFNRFRSLEPGPLRTRLLELAATMQVPVRDVLVADASRRTTKVNAYVSGLGRTRRVVVYDTLLAAATPQAAATGAPAASPGGADEVALVVAHELAHVRHRDVLWGTIGAAALAAVSVLAAAALFDLEPVQRALGVRGLGDPLAVPGLLLMAALGGLAAAPVASAISRWAEARADWVSLEVTRDPVTAVAVERRLALENRADLRPNRLLMLLFASHPSTMARISQAWLWEQRNGSARAASRGGRH